MRPSTSNPLAAWSRKPGSRRRSALIDLGIVNLVAFALAGIFLNGSLGEWGGDNVKFLLLARSLATGEGYVDLHLVGTPPHVHYPPLYPLLLAPLVALDAPLVVLKAWTAILSVAGLNAAYLLLASTGRRSVALLSVLCTLCAGAFLDPALSVMSDGPFALLLVAALLGIRRCRRDGKEILSRGIAAGALIGVAILTRTAGVVLLPALLAHAAFDRRSGVPVRRRVAVTLLAASVAVAVASPWFVWAAAQEGTDRRTYLGEFTTEEGAAMAPSNLPAEGGDDAGLVRRVLLRPLQNLVDIRVKLTRSASASAPRGLGERGAVWLSWTFVALCGLLAAATAAGLARALIVRRDARDWYVVGYLALLAIWVGGGFRLLMPVLVFLFAYCHDGIVWAVGRIGRLRLRRDPGRNGTDAARAGTAMLALLLIANVVVTATFPRLQNRLHGRHAPWWHEYLAATRSLASMAHPDDLVLSAPDNVPFHVAGLQAPRIRIHGRDESAALAALRASSTTFVISTPFLRTYSVRVARCVEVFPEQFETIDAGGDVQVYRVLEDPGTAPDRPGARRENAPRPDRGHPPAPSTSER
jgi:4-amino-4-deoxy-L-arabinose transferase-like glycosyltransferase